MYIILYYDICIYVYIEMNILKMEKATSVIW